MWDMSLTSAQLVPYLHARHGRPGEPGPMVPGCRGLPDGVVIHVRATGRDLIVKAGSPPNHHIDREIAAHRAGIAAFPLPQRSWCSCGRRTQLREAVGTACWAHQAGDATFEAQGHRMVADVLRSL